MSKANEAFVCHLFNLRSTKTSMLLTDVNVYNKMMFALADTVSPLCFGVASMQLLKIVLA